MAAKWPHSHFSSSIEIADFIERRELPEIVQSSPLPQFHPVAAGMGGLSYIPDPSGPCLFILYLLFAMCYVLGIW